jgi:ABC-type multidrug transport system fused ATPase/permease subunit
MKFSEMFKNNVIQTEYLIYTYFLLILSFLMLFIYLIKNIVKERKKFLILDRDIFSKYHNKIIFFKEITFELYDKLEKIDLNDQEHNFIYQNLAYILTNLNSYSEQIKHIDNKLEEIELELCLLKIKQRLDYLNYRLEKIRPIKKSKLITLSLMTRKIITDTGIINKKILRLRVILFNKVKKVLGFKGFITSIVITIVGISGLFYNQIEVLTGRSVLNLGYVTEQHIFIILFSFIFIDTIALMILIYYKLKRIKLARN